ncbi:response regulator [Candidatus Woesearchaeota archaeon]|nr:response regulator [Candidatus Woesearchaeota archaeon]
MRKTVLLVEDEPIVSEMWCNYISEWGYAVKPYRNGELAMHAIMWGLKYDVAVIDLSLEGKIDGLELMEASRGKNPDTPIIIASVYGFKYSEIDYFFLKGDKDLEDLKEVIEDCLSKREQAQ